MRSPWARRSARRVAFTPFLGFHLLITFGVAWLAPRQHDRRRDRRSCVGNPMTYPLHLGRHLPARPAHARRASDRPRRRGSGMICCTSPGISSGRSLKPMTVGSIPLGLAVGLRRLSHCLQSGFRPIARGAASASPDGGRRRARRPSEDIEDASHGTPSWRQHRPCRDRAERARRQPSPIRCAPR